ncbi:GNAT family N-acetyltransferase [Massilia horti]|uniref:GNAT family N-acetyltransferase n=1 Tax=Massilia horti TaxID=2562153 RepID=A0A4Y9T6E5_9BURK|nr:GNAT family N-acetyltransferase [Massilia horti]TFW33777.1 GNAT family N-acetyltransferase [Massilia horti]
MKNMKPSVMVGHKDVWPMRVSSQAAAGGEVSTICYEDDIPTFVEAELVRLYGHMNSSLTYLMASSKANGASTYVARNTDRMLAVLLFKRNAIEVQVINEMCKIDAVEIARFADFVFSTYASVTRISFSMLENGFGRLPYPSQRYNFSEDIVLDMPSCTDAYLESLSSKTRRGIRGNLTKIKRDHPSFQFQVFEKDQITVQQIRDIIELSKARIGAKHLRYGTTEDDIQCLLQVVRACGLAGIVFIDGKICAGIVNSHLGNGYFGHVVAHDPHYNKYGLGILCCYLTICAEIERGGATHHFCWGRYNYKYRLGGVQKDMICLDVYRSRAWYFRNVQGVAKNALQTSVARIKTRLLDIEREETGHPGLVSRAVRILRKLKRSRFSE